MNDLTVALTVDTSKFMKAMQDTQAAMRTLMYFQPYMLFQKRGWGEAAYWAGVKAREEGSA